MSGDAGRRSFHGELKKKYLKVPDDGRIETEAFLDASQDSVIPLLDSLGSKAFVFVKSDVNGNISKLRKRLSENPEKFKTLHDMVEDEIERKVTDAKNSATDALLWLVRGLHFICKFVLRVAKQKEEEENLQPCLQEAYETTLKKYHAWLVQKTIQLSFKAAPYYSDLMESLSNGASKEVIIEDINEYVDVLQQNIDAIQDFYAKSGLPETPLSC